MHNYRKCAHTMADVPECVFKLHPGFFVYSFSWETCRRNNLLQIPGLTPDTPVREEH